MIKLISMQKIVAKMGDEQNSSLVNWNDKLFWSIRSES